MASSKCMCCSCLYYLNVKNYCMAKSSDTTCLNQCCEEFKSKK